MLLPATRHKPLNKKGLSIVIGYVLLIAVSIVMSVIVYQWLKTYVPKDALVCPDGTSFFMKEAVYDCTPRTLTLTFKNNGRFGIDGYFIHGSTDTNLNTLATVDLSSYLGGSDGEKSGTSIRFSSNENSLSPEETGNTQTHLFNIPASLGTLHKIEIIPIRMQARGANKVPTPVSCSDAKIEAILACKQ